MDFRRIARAIHRYDGVDWRSFYDERLREAIGARYKQDVERFGYRVR